MRERGREGRIAPALRDPRRVEHEAEGAQRLDEPQPARVEVAELAVALDQHLALALALGVAARDQHPDVVDRRAGHEIVEVEEEPALVAVEQVPAVAVAVNAVHGDARAPGVVERGHLLHHRAVAAPDFLGQEAAGLEEAQRRERARRRVQSRAVRRRRRRAHVVDARQQASQDRELLVAELLR